VTSAATRARRAAWSIRLRPVTAPAQSLAFFMGVGRLNCTFLDECFRLAGRTTRDVGVDAIQRDRDQFLEYYNLRRSHQRGHLSGRTPAQAMQALRITELPPRATIAEGEEVSSAA
jgi:hypothetical protein